MSTDFFLRDKILGQMESGRGGVEGCKMKMEQGQRSGRRQRLWREGFMIWFQVVKGIHEQGSLFSHSSESLQRHPGEGSVAHGEARTRMGGCRAWERVLRK